MHSRLVSLVLALVVGLVVAPAPVAGVAGPPTSVLTDAQEDQDVTPGTLVVQPPAMGQVDIKQLLAGVTESDNLTFSLLTSAQVTATETVTLSFNVARGPTSMGGST